ncbi:hypothetical protein FB451DRAFT_1251090 [Mycena latifolia]|nr:hypothetical protein FB451DRAFT_1251090 [Mycena latifolia]
MSLVSRRTSKKAPHLEHSGRRPSRPPPLTPVPRLAGRQTVFLCLCSRWRPPPLLFRRWPTTLSQRRPSTVLLATAPAFQFDFATPASQNGLDFNFNFFSTERGAQVSVPPKCPLLRQALSRAFHRLLTDFRHPRAGIHARRVRKVPSARMPR